MENKTLFPKEIYVMKTQPHGWEVRRVLSDYKWLSERLSREFPQISVFSIFKPDS